MSTSNLNTDRERREQSGSEREKMQSIKVGKCSKSDNGNRDQRQEETKARMVMSSLPEQREQVTTREV